MKSIRKFAGKFTKKLGIAPDIFPGVAKLEMLGANEVRITNHRGIIEYSKEKIRINTSEGTVDITGEALEISIISSEELAVSGIIGKISKQGGDFL